MSLSAQWPTAHRRSYANLSASVTGETFNKTGKTNILLRHEKGNLFVAECKFWAGPKGLLETIDQRLSYLT